MNLNLWRHQARAWLFHFIGRDAQAYDEYVTAFELAPSARAASHLGFIACTHHRFAEGARWFETALRLNPGHADTLFNLGYALEQGSRPAEACIAFAQAVQAKPALDRAWYGLAMAQARLGRHAEATQALEETVRLQPMHGEAWYHLGMACHLSDKSERLQEVIVSLKRFDPKRANQLILDCGRAEVAHLRSELPF